MKYSHDAFKVLDYLAYYPLKYSQSFYVFQEEALKSKGVKIATFGAVHPIVLLKEEYGM